MKVFLFEFITGGGLFFTPDWGAPGGSLLTEGFAMFSALAQDVSQIDGCELSILWDHRINLPMPTELRQYQVASRNEAASRFEQLQRESDLVFVIAPELDGQLEFFCRQVDRSTTRLIAPSLDFVRLASDKHAMAEFLRDRNINIPLTIKEFGTRELKQLSIPFIVKPARGAGSTDIHLYESYCDVPLSMLRNPNWCAQEFNHGRPASIAFLCGPEEKRALPPMWQFVEASDRFIYRGGQSITDPVMTRRATVLAKSALSRLPEAAGYIGIDLLLGKQDDGSQDVIIEMNPRLTTSYVALRSLTNQNLAEAMIQIYLGKGAHLTFQERDIEFFPNGKINMMSS